ncbi:MAG: hypothetical protein GWN99_13985 [Gemmatimonadetes bacterium]|uniref:Type 4 fimbrial biogenesis protein PilX N-terminal domain-containing protein n=1 Tax=Candidatus Kutchimonas denitrificans TaxID=3056748 RepID=A0AAE5CC77_9BACT|nr:hypothetical protein [Gemmatimonadota bacterium]NIR75330.1 hypothetical protein [Candidatus Kutchimonas denitrificans]NIS02156.1 hypothetical protein [Gemmatimonadota bacterium]NIT67981.1 hypothetical protein [Gemmatimonadota bacterium]NIU53975.1 hypothetical protein [Gemmatimonadota bacterium]
MMTSKNPKWSSDRSGLALIMTIMVLAVVGTIVGAMVTVVMASVRTAGMEYHEGRVFYAAEAGGEAALAQIKLALQDGLLEDTELTDMTAPVMDGFNFDQFEVQKMGTPIVETITDGPFAGLYALTQNVRITSLAEDRAGNLGGVVLDAKAQAIPIFQFGVFFHEDLEATNGPPMDFAGRVHSNGNIYLSSANAWYREMITTPGEIVWDRKDFHSKKTGVYINDGDGNEVNLDFDSRSIPDPEAFKFESCEKFDCRLQTGAFGVEELRLPLPEEVPPYELIRPQETDDGAAEKSVKFAWNADTYIEIDLTSLSARSVVCEDGDDDGDDDDGETKWWPKLTVVRDGLPVPNQPQLCDIATWRWSAFYDGREEEMKDVLTIDIEQLDAWIGGDASRATRVIYVEFVVPGTIAGYPSNVQDLLLDATIDPAVRLKNGDPLPNEMTVATDWPLYVQGNYNVAPKKPAGLASDGLTILSKEWRDWENRPDDEIVEDCEGLVFDGHPCPDFEAWAAGWDYREARETTVNAGVIAGHWPTPCDHHDVGCAADGSDDFYQDWYGGGIENFPRFLESWRQSGAKVLFHFRGALISPFTSQKTEGTWNGSYYRPPARDWAFDTDFRDPELLPPGTPNVGSVIRTAMREAF